MGIGFSMKEAFFRLVVVEDILFLYTIYIMMAARQGPVKYGEMWRSSELFCEYVGHHG